MIPRKQPRSATVAVFAVGHKPYWAQFEGLLDRLMSFHQEFIRQVNQNHVTVLDYGMVDSSSKGVEVLRRMQKDQPDLIFCNMVTYATSSTFAPIVRDLRVPMVLVALQPQRHLEYLTATTRMQLENDNICAVPEFTCAANRLGHPVADVILGTLYQDEKAQRELGEWCEIAKVLHGLRNGRFGLMGHVMEAMYDMHTDPTAVSAAFGVHVPLIEIDDAVRLYRTVTETEIERKSRLILEEFETPEPKSDPVTRKLTPEDLRDAAQAAVMLDKLVETYSLSGLAYYYEGQEGSIQRKVASTLIVGNSILNAQGIPMCGEFDLKTCLAMFIMDRLGIGGSFAEFHPFDFDEDFILVGHDGPHHIAIAEGKPVLRSLSKFHGKPGCGASVEFKIKEGPITMLGITQEQNGGFKFVIGEGMSMKGQIPATGNTNTRAFFEPNTPDFIRAWMRQCPTHHYALGVGHHAPAIQKIAEILGIPAVIVRA